MISSIAHDSAMTVFDFSVKRLDCATLDLADLRGQVLLIVNTASRCGFTPQYAGLDALYRTYRERGFAVLGFPCNQFGGQEPGSAQEIAHFCATKFNVSFPLMAKIDVNGAHADPLFQFLRERQPGLLGVFGVNRIRWNFTKFLVDREGNAVGRFGPAVQPEKLTKKIEELLASGSR